MPHCGSAHSIRIPEGISVNMFPEKASSDLDAEDLQCCKQLQFHKQMVTQGLRSFQDPGKDYKDLNVEFHNNDLSLSLQQEL